MKIEKLTENKIRVIVNSSDLKLINSTETPIISSTLDNHNFLFDLLKRAKDEVGFETDGFKLLIEIISSSDDFVVFTITKYSLFDKKLPVVKRKISNDSKTSSIYKFETFEEFCNFCNCINKIKSFNYKTFSKNFSIYYYKNTYYLLIKNINNSCKNKGVFYALISEFSKPLYFSNVFENKLREYGKIIIRKNAIEKCIKYFS